MPIFPVYVRIGIDPLVGRHAQSLDNTVWRGHFKLRTFSLLCRRLNIREMKIMFSGLKKFGNTIFIVSCIVLLVGFFTSFAISALAGVGLIVAFLIEVPSLRIQLTQAENTIREIAPLVGGTLIDYDNDGKADAIDYNGDGKADYTFSHHVGKPTEKV